MANSKLVVARVISISLDQETTPSGLASRKTWAIFEHPIPWRPSILVSRTGLAG